MFFGLDFLGFTRLRNHPYWVQGVASSNPAAPTKRINELGQPLGWPFSFPGWLFADFRDLLVGARRNASTQINNRVL